MMKNFRCQVFRFAAVSHAPNHVRVHTFEVDLIKLGKTGRISLRRLDQQALVCFLLQSLQRELRILGLHRE